MILLYNADYHNNTDGTLDQSVTFEEIMDIVQHRHNLEIIGDNDIM